MKPETTAPPPPDAADPAPSASARHTAEDLRRILAETRSLLTVAFRDGAARLAEPMQPPAAPDVVATLVEQVKQDLQQVRSDMSAEGPSGEREIARFACDVLQLHLVCRRKCCRRAQRCRGEPDACHARASVPEPAHEWVASLLIGRRAPWLPPLVRGNAAHRQAYECWIAGLEAGARSARGTR